MAGAGGTREMGAGGGRGPGRAHSKESGFFLSTVRRKLLKPTSNVIKIVMIERLLLSVVWRIEEARMTSKRWGGGYFSIRDDGRDQR